MRTWLLCVALVVAVSGCSAERALEPPDDDPVSPSGYLIVAADSLDAVAAEYATYRQGGGFTTRAKTVSALLAGADAAQLPAKVHGELISLRASLPPGSPLFLLLLGDAPGEGEATKGQIPAITCTNLLGGCHSDNRYADLDGDGLPDVAMARVPARSAAQARAYLDKLRRHEATYEIGTWNRRLSLYTGQPNFDPMIDAAIETAVLEGLKRLSPAFDVVGAYDNPKSPYYYQPFEEKALDMFEEGAVMVAYVGHGSATWTEGLTAHEAATVRCAHRLPVAMFVACTNGQYLGPEDSIAESLLWNPEGPIAAIGAADVSHPYSNAVLAYETMRSTLNEAPRTVGEAFLAARRALVEHDDDFRRFVDAAAAALVSADEQPVLRRQNVDLYNLFGDPAAMLRFPRRKVDFDAVPEGRLGSGELEVHGTVPGLGDGTVRVSFEADRDVILGELTPGTSTAVVQANWKKAVDKVVVEEEVELKGGQFSASLRWTPPLPAGNYFVKAYAEDGRGDGFGAIAVR